MSPQAGYLLQEEVVPRLRGAIPHNVRCVGAEDPEELIQDGTAIAAKMLHNAEAAGKKVTPGNIAYYTIQHLKSGRRSTGSTVVDVLGTGTQLNGAARLTSFDEVAPWTWKPAGRYSFSMMSLPATRKIPRWRWHAEWTGKPSSQRYRNLRGTCSVSLRKVEPSGTPREHSASATE